MAWAPSTILMGNFLFTVFDIIRVLLFIHFKAFSRALAIIQTLPFPADNKQTVVLATASNDKKVKLWQAPSSNPRKNC